MNVRPGENRAVSGAEAERLLRAAGLRNTAARRAVIHEITRAGAPMSHGEMIAALASRSFDRATVYRVLIDLEAAGILLRTDLGDRLWRFELNRREAHGRDHPHFVCTACSAVSCLPSASFALRAEGGVPASVTEGAYAVRIAGICDACTMQPGVRTAAAPTRASRRPRPHTRESRPRPRSK